MMYLLWLVSCNLPGHGRNRFVRVNTVDRSFFHPFRAHAVNTCASVVYSALQQKESKAAIQFANPVSSKDYFLLRTLPSMNQRKAIPIKVQLPCTNLTCVSS